MSVQAYVLIQTEVGKAATVVESIRAIPGVRRTETFMYLKLRKQSYTWGTR